VDPLQWIPASHAPLSEKVIGGADGGAARCYRGRAHNAADRLTTRRIHDGLDAAFDALARGAQLS
jgi:hypothetical protein